MTFAGLPDNLLYALLGGAAGAVTILYLLKLRRRRVLVPFSPLWARILEQREATSLLKKLKRLLSWLVQLVFVSLLVFALADPRPASETKEIRYTAILIDASASMQSSDELPSRLHKAKEEAKDLVRGLGSEEQAMVVEVGAQATPLGTFTKDKNALLAAVEAVRPSDTNADIARAMETLSASLTGRKNPRIVVFSDGRLPPVPQAQRAALEKVVVEGKLIGKGGDNIGITSFNVRRYLTSPGEYEAYLELRNFSDQPVTCDVTLSVVLPKTCQSHGECPSGYECDKLLAVCANPQGVIPPVSLAPRGVWRKIVPGLQSDGGRLVATAEPREFKDVFPIDNRAYAYLQPRRPARILFVTEQNLFLEALLLLDPQNVVTKLVPADYRPSADYDLTIFDDVAPDTKGLPGNYLYIHPSGKFAPMTTARKPVKAPVVATVKNQNPILRWVALKDLNIIEADPLDTEPGDQVLVSGVGKGGLDTPLLIARETAKGKTLVFTFDLKKSDLPLRWSFPVLIPNLVAWMKGESREENSSYVTGQRWNVPLPSRLDKVTVLGPDGVRREAPVRDGHAQVFGTRAGFYELYPSDDGEARNGQPGALGGDPKTPAKAATTRTAKAKAATPSGSEDRAPLVVVAANLQDPGESDVLPATELRLGGKKAGSVSKAEVVERDLWVWLLLAALGITIVEWLTYHRRVTV